MHPATRIATITILTITAASCFFDRHEVSPYETLPFYQSTDWTPSWIGSNDPAYANIHQIPAFRLTDQSGNVCTEKNLDGKITVANFFFTRCRSICPKLSTHMHDLQDAFQGNREVLLISHSVDPASDSVPILSAYAEAYDVQYDQWRLLTGNKDEIYHLARKHYFAGDSIGTYPSGNDFLHTENFILLDKQRRIRGLYHGTLKTEMLQLEKDIRLLMNE